MKYVLNVTPWFKKFNLLRFLNRTVDLVELILNTYILVFDEVFYTIASRWWKKFEDCVVLKKERNGNI